MAYLDVKTTTDVLDDVKDSLTAAARSSQAEDSVVYPVQLSPVDWFEDLVTSFSEEDLTADYDVILDAIDSKSSELDTLHGQLLQLHMAFRTNFSELEGEGVSYPKRSRRD